MSNTKRTVLVAGAQGVIGRAAALRFARDSNTTVLGLSRRSGLEIPRVDMVPVDLLRIEDVQAKLSSKTNVTHIVFGAYIERDTPSEKSEANVSILRNLLDVVEVSSSALRHVTIYQGGKAYGADLGPFKTPAREDDPRVMYPNFYYEQEDLLRSRQSGKTWNFTVLRPEAVMGFAVGNPMNLMMVIAVYAAISKELGLPLRFPGTEKAYRALYQVSSADILAKATDWAGTTPAAANQIFNITNGDYFRWVNVWPTLARVFGMEEAQPVPIPLRVYMRDKERLWTEMTEKYDLLRIPYGDLVSWPFGDAILNTEFDNITSTIRARKAGFADCIDTEEMFKALLKELSTLRVIPPLPQTGEP